MLSIFDKVRTTWGKIIEPSQMVQEEARRDRLRTFTMIFLVAGVFTTAIAIAYVVRALVDPRVMLHATSIFGASALLFGALWLTRRGYLSLSLALLCLYGAPSNFALVIYRNQPTAIHLYDYLTLITVVGGLFLSRRLMVLVFVYNAVWMILTPVLATEVRIEHVLEGPFLFNLMMLAISLVGVALYQRAEEKRSATIERERIFYKSLFEQSNDAVFLMTLEGRNFAANHRAEELLGYTIAELAKMEVAAVVVPQERDQSERRRQAIMGGDILTPYERTFHHRDGSEVIAEVNVALIRDEQGKPLHFQSIVRDISDRKRQQAERLQLARAEERIGTMRQFVAAISHDFRTTLAQIEMGSYLARRAVDAGKTDAARAKLDSVSDSVQHMGEQLENLSTVASLMTLSLESCDINAVIQGLAASLRDLIQTRHIRLDLDLDPNITAITIDPDKMHNALKQLLVNAAAHTPIDGHVEICTHLSGGMVAISVRDEGIGIEAEQIQRLFEPLYRSDFARPVDGGGMGLGLTIVKLVTEAHGGRIEVESMPNKGSLFRVLLPYEQE